MVRRSLHIIFLVLFFTPVLLMSQQQWMSEHAFFNSHNRLVYQPDELGNIIPDFSHVGYQFGDEAIPEIDVKIEIFPIPGDNGNHIQSAIDFVAGLPLGDNGYRGAVFLHPGTYEVAGQLNINTSGVVLRGSGQNEDGTKIIATGTSQRTLLRLRGEGELSEISGTRRNIIESYVPVGRQYLVLENASGYHVGDDFVIFRPGTENWISDLQMDQIPPDPNGGTVNQWVASAYSLRYERVVSKVSGDTLFFRNPVVMAMEDQYGSGQVYKSEFTGRIQNVGVENIRFLSEYISNTDENHSWIAIEFNRIMHSWVRNITAKYFSYAAVSIDNSAKHISVLDCTSLEPKSVVTGGRRYSFNNNGQLNLFSGCFASEGRHDYVLGARVCGPNVFTRSSAELASNDIGPHHRWATGALFDMITTNHFINVQDRGWSGTGHGWAGANMVFWNCTASGSVTQSPWVSAKNYNIGFTGQKHPGNWFTDRPDGVWEGHNEPGLFPQSLYTAQFEDRLWDSDDFYVFPTIEMVNSTTLRITFNKDVNPETGGNIAHYTFGGTAGITGNPISAQVALGNRVFLTTENLDLLEPFSTITIAVSLNVLSAEGHILKGSRTLKLVWPDMRPIVISEAQNITVPEVLYAIAQVDKPAMVYLILAGTQINDPDNLEHAIADQKGVKEFAASAFEEVYLPVSNLQTGVYYFYAVDEAGRMSERSNKAVILNNPILGVHDLDKSFHYRVINGQLQIFPEHLSGYSYNVAIYDMTGRAIWQKSRLSGPQTISLPPSPGIYLLKIFNRNQMLAIKIISP